ncbi:MAG TPA: 50S ribosomal protein L24 [Bacillota bacterium]|nr:50S ribosomal protein L24 [Clostridiales bacterium]HPT85821.1 50S ribosomal protein L24 [Bacillota bacterium]
MANKLHIRRDDEVIVISGDDKGKRGKVLEVSPKEGKVIVQGVNIVSRHLRPRRQGEAGGIVKVEAPMYACKVMLYCSKCNKGVRAKAGTNSKGEKIRVCAKCGAEL